VDSSHVTNDSARHFLSWADLDRGRGVAWFIQKWCGIYTHLPSTPFPRRLWHSCPRSFFPHWILTKSHSPWMISMNYSSSVSNSYAQPKYARISTTPHLHLQTKCNLRFCSLLFTINCLIHDQSAFYHMPFWRHVVIIWQTETLTGCKYSNCWTSCCAFFHIIKTWREVIHWRDEKACLPTLHSFRCSPFYRLHNFRHKEAYCLKHWLNRVWDNFWNKPGFLSLYLFGENFYVFPLYQSRQHLS
jgi:hypothetical protein